MKNGEEGAEPGRRADEAGGQTGTRADAAYWHAGKLNLAAATGIRTGIGRRTGIGSAVVCPKRGMSPRGDW